MVALDGEAGDGAQQVGLRAEALEMLDRLVDQMRRLLARPITPSSDTKVSLPAAPSLPTRLPVLASSPSTSSRSSAIWKARPTSRA